LLGVVLAVAREYNPPSFDVYLPCDAGILGGFSGCFLGFFLVGFGLFRPGVARAPGRDSSSNISLVNYILILITINLYLRNVAYR